MGPAVSEEPRAALTTFGVFVFCQGVGNVLARPESAALLNEGVERDGYGLLRFKSMVVFTGSSMLVSAASVGIRLLRSRPIIAD